MQPISILLLCRADRSEFQQPLAMLRAWGEVTTFADVSAAVQAIAAGAMAPDVVAIAPAFPGQYSHQEVDALRRHAPLARFVGILGSWCEGEMRTGSPWPGVVRAYWHQWTTRGGRELERLSQGRPGAWTLPPTATEEERLLLGAAEPWPEQHGLVVVHTRSHEMGETLVEACRKRGYATVWPRTLDGARIAGATAGIFDADGLSESECAELRQFVRVVRPSPVIALASFPRIEDRRRAESCGAARLLSKPLLLEDLFETLACREGRPRLLAGERLSPSSKGRGDDGCA